MKINKTDKIEIFKVTSKETGFVSFDAMITTESKEEWTYILYVMKLEYSISLETGEFRLGWFTMAFEFLRDVLIGDPTY